MKAMATHSGDYIKDEFFKVVNKPGEYGDRRNEIHRNLVTVIEQTVLRKIRDQIQFEDTIHEDGTITITATVEIT